VKKEKSTRNAEIVLSVAYTRVRSLFVVRIIDHRRITNSTVKPRRIKSINHPGLPTASNKVDSAKKMEICPKLKKRIIKRVVINIAFGQLLTSLKQRRQKTKVSAMEKSNGLRIIFVLSTSRKFQVRRARLG